jgi:hypothetical protein
MMARQLHHHPAWTAPDLTADLAAARNRLELMITENVSVAAAFDLSYQDLGAGQQRMFRRVGLSPGPDIDAYAAAALDDIDVGTARRRLAALYDHYLFTEPSRGRSESWTGRPLSTARRWTCPARWTIPLTRRSQWLAWGDAHGPQAAARTRRQP